MSSCVVSCGSCGRVWCHTRPLPGRWQQVAVGRPTAGTAALRLGPPGRGSYCDIFTLISFRPAKAISQITPLMVPERFKNMGANVQDKKRVPIVHPRGQRTLLSCLTAFGVFFFHYCFLLFFICLCLQRAVLQVNIHSLTLFASYRPVLCSPLLTSFIEEPCCIYLSTAWKLIHPSGHLCTFSSSATSA